MSGVVDRAIDRCERSIREQRRFAILIVVYGLTNLGTLVVTGLVGQWFAVGSCTISVIFSILVVRQTIHSRRWWIDQLAFWRGAKIIDQRQAREVRLAVTARRLSAINLHRPGN